MLPLHRSFSSQVEKKASKPPKPPRRPPIPPRRSPSRSGDDDDDYERARAATTTGRDRLEESKNLEEQNRKMENERDKIETRQAEAIKFEADKVERSKRLLDGLDRFIRGIRDKTKSDMNRMYEEFQTRVDHRNYLVEARCEYIGALPNEIRLEMEKAAKRGRLDYRSDQHQESTGLADLRRDVENTADEIYGCLREVAERKYAKDWAAWYGEKTEFQLNEVIEATNRLKMDKGLHVKLRDQAEEVANITSKASRILVTLNKNLDKTSHSLTLREAKLYVRITSRITQEIRFLAENFMQESHHWRKLDRFAVAASRFPELNNHVILETEIMPLVANLQESTSYIAMLITTLQAYKRKPTRELERKPLLFGPLVDSMAVIRKEYLALSSGGLTLLNPLLDSELGRLKYAAFHPFETFFNASQELGNAIRGCFDFFQDIIEDTQETRRKRVHRSGSSELTEQDTERDRWLQKVSKEINDADKKDRRFKRSYMADYNKLSFLMVTRLLNSSGDDPNLKRILSERYERPKTEHNEALSFDGLSEPSLYQHPMKTNSLMHPIKLRGDGMLYPLKKDYPIEFISLEARVVQVLKELPSNSVVAVDMLGPQDERAKPAYVSIATTEKVFLFDWDWWMTESGSALTKFLENPDILKVVHNIHVIENYLSERGIRPRGIVSIERSLKNHTHLDNRLAPLGRHWKPTGQSYMSWGSLFEFITDLAYFPTYDLLTFLSAATPECISSLQPELKANISQARERMYHRIATADKSGLVLGPVKWEHIGMFRRLKKAHHVEIGSPDTLKIITRMQAARDLSRRSREARRIKEEVKIGSIDRDDLAAYYMFTTFNEELHAISTMLKMENVAGRVLRVSKTLKLSLHPEDVKTLKDVVGETAQDKRAEEKVKSETGLKIRYPGLKPHQQYEPTTSHSKPEITGFEPLSKPQVTAKEPSRSTDENKNVDGSGKPKQSQNKNSSSYTVSSKRRGVRIRPTLSTKRTIKIRRSPSGPSNAKGPKISSTKSNLKARSSLPGPSSPRPRKTLTTKTRTYSKPKVSYIQSVPLVKVPGVPFVKVPVLPITKIPVPRIIKVEDHIVPHQHAPHVEKLARPKQNKSSYSPSDKVDTKKEQKPGQVVTTPSTKLKVKDPKEQKHRKVMITPSAKVKAAESKGSSTTDSTSDVEMALQRRTHKLSEKAKAKSGKGKKETMVGTKSE